MTRSCIPDDEPKTSISEDMMFRKEIVEELCKVIKTNESSSSLVIGICGRWGTGKTSVTNFIKEKIRNEKDVIIIDFNPWLYSSQETLSSQLLSQISYSIYGHHKIKRFFVSHQPVKGIVSYFSKESVSTAGKFLLWLGKKIIDAQTYNLLTSFSELIKENKNGISLEKQKETISLKIKASNHKLLIIIDDLDRLDSNEIKMMMKLVRSVADFPNVVYILCYDQTIVEKALSENNNIGHEYLQKIVNLQISLPEIKGTVLKESIKSEYLKVIGRQDINESEQCMVDCAWVLIKSMRESKLIISRFQVIFSISRNNTCPMDLFILILIESLDPTVYNWISDNRFMLCMGRVPSAKELFSNDQKTISDEYDDVKLNPDFKPLISLLFPSFKSNYPIYGSDMMDYRIRQYPYLENYFKLAPSSLEITDEFIETIMNIDDPDSFYNTIISEEDQGSIIANRLYDKIVNNPCQIENAKRLSDFVLSQNFTKGYYFPIRFINLIKVPEAYIQHLESTPAVINYFKSTWPRDDIHKMIFNSTIVYELCLINKSLGLVAYRDNFKNEIQEMKKSYLENTSNIDDEDLLLILTCISKVDYDAARYIFIETVPENERSDLYQRLNKKGWDVSILLKLVECHNDK